MRYSGAASEASFGLHRSWWELRLLGLSARTPARVRCTLEHWLGRIDLPSGILQVIRAYAVVEPPVHELSGRPRRHGDDH